MITKTEFLDSVDERAKPAAAVLWDLVPPAVLDGSLQVDHEAYLRQLMVRFVCSRVTLPDRREVAGNVVSRLFDLVAARLAAPVVNDVDDDADEIEDTVILTDPDTEETTDGSAIDHTS